MPSNDQPHDQTRPHGEALDDFKSGDLIFDWNLKSAVNFTQGRKVFLDDETLRDGLQNPSVFDPPIEEKFQILHLMEALGIETVNIGLPGAGPRAYGDTLALANEIVRAKLKIRPNCAARTHENDIRPIAEISQKAGIAIEAATFLGSSPIRRLVEDWTVDHLARTTENAVKFAVAQGLPVMYVTEDTIRTDPDTVKRLYRTAINCGAKAAVLCDTVGHATPMGTYALIKFFVEEVVNPSGESIRVDWHGHNDRGLAVANSLAAILAGADQIHAAANALGERVGNTPMELMLVNLRLLGLIDRDLSRLKEYCETVARATHTTIPPNYPVIGRDAFRTATGVHAAAIIKAFRKADAMLANTVYSGVPANLFGLEQIIEIGPLSGKSNVSFWLERHGITASDEIIARILDAAKKSSHVLSDEELFALSGEKPRPAATHTSGTRL
jgi:2-isopropylmalate synthase